MTFTASRVSFRYPRSNRDAIHDLDLQVDTGEIVAVIGPNGSGKSTLLRVLLGAVEPFAGTVRLEGRDIHEWPREEIARSVGVVTQAEEFPFPIVVRELVAMGRYPHLGAWRRESDVDRAAVRHAMERCGVADLEHRSVLELSGGERQRARVARALAQQPRTLLLDEPTASLDIAHAMSLFELLSELRDDRVTIIVVTHDINIAARYADRLVLLDRGHIVAAGAPAGVLTRETIERVYEWPVAIRSEDDAPQVIPQRKRQSTDGRGS